MAYRRSLKLARLSKNCFGLKSKSEKKIGKNKKYCTHKTLLMSSFREGYFFLSACLKDNHKDYDFFDRNRYPDCFQVTFMPRGYKPFEMYT